MNIQKLKTAVAEANRFLDKALPMLERANEFGLGQDPNASFTGSNAAAAKRASLDLSRSLAALRRRD